MHRRSPDFQGGRRVIGENMGWEFEPEFEPPPAGETEQLTLLELEPPEWKLPQRVREVGLASVRNARKELR